MKNNTSHIQDSKLMKKEETENSLNTFYYNKFNTTVKKIINEEKKAFNEKIIHKTQLKKIENNLCLAQNIKFNHNGKKVTKTKIKPKNSFIKSPKESSKLSKNQAVKKIFSPKNDLCPYHTITSKKYSHKNHNIKIDNEILLIMPHYSKNNFDEKKDKDNNNNDNYSENKSHKNKILSCNNIYQNISTKKNN